MNAIKKSVGIILALLMTLSVFAVVPVSAGETDFAVSGIESGQTGSCIWSYDSGTCKLTISGNGYMEDYSYSNSRPWSGKNIVDVEIKEGVLNVGNSAFSSIGTIKRVTVSSSVKNIGSYAFYNCYGLIDLRLADTIESIETSSFEKCSSLKEIHFPNALKIVGVDAFAQSGLLSADLSNTQIETVGKHAFVCQDMIEVAFPRTIKDIGTGAVGRTPNHNFPYEYQYADIPEGFTVKGFSGTAAETYVGQPGGYYLGKMKWVFIPLDKCIISFDSNGGTGTMDDIRNVSSEEYFTLPECTFAPPTDMIFDKWDLEGKKYSVGSKITLNGNITLKATWRTPQNVTISFNGNSGSGTMNSITVLEGIAYTVPACSFTRTSKKFDFWLCDGKKYLPGDTVTVSGDMTFAAQWSDKQAWHVYFDANGGKGGMSWDYGYEGDSFTVPKSRFTPPTRKKFNEWHGSDGKDYAPGDVIYPTGDLTLSASWATADCYNVFFDEDGGSGYMSWYVYDGEIYELPDCEFDAPEGKEFRCWSYNGKFYYPGDYLQLIKSDITVKAVWKDKEAEYEYRDNGDGTVTFYRYRGEDSELYVPAEYNGVAVTIFGSGTNYAVYDLDNLETIVLSYGVEIVSSRAVQNCDSLTSVLIPNSVTEIGNSAFNDNPSLSEVKIGSGVTKIGDWAFENCASLRSVTIPASVTSIGMRAFGYYENPDWNGEDGEAYSKVADFTIRGAKGSAAQNYAIENGFNFIVAEEPIVTKEEKTDEITGVKVEADSTVELDVQPIGKGGIAVAVDGSIAAAYDITLKKDGVAVQPDGMVTVSIPCKDKDAKVYRVEVDNSVTDMKAVYKSGYLVFTTDHFSLYVVTVPASTEPTSETTLPAETTNPVETTEPQNATDPAATTVPVATTEPQVTTAPVTTAPAVIAKKANPVKVTVKTKSVKLKNLKKKAQTVKAITVKNAKGKVTYKLTSVPKKIKKLTKISSKGAITIKKWKKAKKGTYKFKVNITAAGNDAYKPKSVTKVVKIKIK